MQRNSTENNIRFTRVGLENFLNLAGEDDTEELVTIEKFDCEVAGVVDDDARDILPEHDSAPLQAEERNSTSSVERQLEGLSLCKASLERHISLSLSLRERARRLEFVNVSCA